ncbi:MAG: 3-isopropylmalate dehydratase small subunit [Terrimicrobiaceae bacterium]|nr:3-isopropylmalate dehydratase small subunit [Terrimicrobiaceae bacterium]
MALEKITQVTGRGVPVPGDDIDTDRIIPARFMKCVTFDGLGEFAFADARAATKAEGGVHPLDDPKFQGASILISGSNFGCGSSREHAPQALYRFGIRAVLAESFAEIFFGNSITLGMPCVVLSKADLQSISGLVAANPQAMITIDVLEGKASIGDMDFAAILPEHAKEALVTGRWDAIADLLEGIDDVKTRAGTLAYMA